MTDSSSPSSAQEPLELDAGVPHSARVWNYWLGGKDNDPVDREAGEQFRAVLPELVQVAPQLPGLPQPRRPLAGRRGRHPPVPGPRHRPAHRQHHPRGRPASGPRHPGRLCRQRPDRARARQGPAPEQPTGHHQVCDADLRDPDKILEGAASLLDFDQPITITLLMILMLIPDAEDPYGIVRRLMNAVPSGSYLAISHPAGDVDSGEIAAAYERLRGLMGEPPLLRSHGEIARFFEGLDLVDPGLVQLHRWRPDPADAESVLHYDVPAYAGVARKP